MKVMNKSPGVLHLGEVEEGTESSTLGLAEGSMVVVKIEPEVDEATGRRLAIDEDVRLGEMPTPRANEELGDLIVELVDSVPGLVMECYSPFHSILQVHLPSHQVLPAWGQCILKIRLIKRKEGKRT